MSMFDRDNDYHVGYFNEHKRRAEAVAVNDLEIGGDNGQD